MNAALKGTPSCMFGWICAWLSTALTKLVCCSDAAWKDLR